MTEKPRVIQVVGPTASGKTSFTVRLAQALGGEIINVDSMQVYRDLAIGTDKPTKQQSDCVPIHGIDLIPLGPPMDASDFAGYARKKIDEIISRGHPCILSGGTGLYHRAIVHGLLDGPSRNDEIRAQLRAQRDLLGIDEMYRRLCLVDPVGASRICPADWIRIERSLEYASITGSPLSAAQDAHGFKSDYVSRLAIGCSRPRPKLYEKIDKRLDQMWSSGIIDETRSMLDAGCDPQQLPLKALGYRQAAMALRGECSFLDALERAKRETRHFAKRQLTWFRADKTVEWLDLPLSDKDFQSILKKCQDFLHQK